MSYLVWLYALLCALVCVRLLLFRRAGGQHRPRVAWLAYLLIVAAGSVPLRLLFGQPVPLDVSGFLAVLVLAAALVAARGNVADLFRPPKLRCEHPIAKIVRKTQ